MTSLRVAMGCLTMLPIGRHGALDAAQLHRATWWFPLVGLGIGAGLAVVHVVASRLWPTGLAGAAVVVAWIAITGGLHLDGLADFCDGLAGGATPAERLRIMRDARVGAMAVVGIAAVVMLKAAAVTALPDRGATRALLLSPCLGRFAMTLLATTSRSARAGDGLGAYFMPAADPRRLLALSAAVAGLAALLDGPRGLAACTVPLGLTLVLRAVCHRRLGGVTGDVFGAAGELTETAVLLVASAGFA